MIGALYWVAIVLQMGYFILGWRNERADPPKAVQRFWTAAVMSVLALVFVAIWAAQDDGLGWGGVWISIASVGLYVLAAWLAERKLRKRQSGRVS